MGGKGLWVLVPPPQGTSTHNNAGSLLNPQIKGTGFVALPLLFRSASPSVADGGTLCGCPGPDPVRTVVMGGRSGGTTLLHHRVVQGAVPGTSRTSLGVHVSAFRGGFC